MKKQKIIIPAPSGGLHTSIAPTLIGDVESALAENVEYISDKARKRPGTSDEGGTENTSSQYPRAGYTFVKSNGTEVPILFDRSSDGATPKVYQAATGATWTWTSLQYSSADFVMNDERTPTFITARGKLLFSNGDYDASDTDGLVYWSGSGDIASTHDSGTQNGISVRFLAYFKERLVGAYGYYCKGDSWSSELTSAIFYSSITDSSGSPVNPDNPDAWHEVDVTYNEIEPLDGSWITALWVDWDSIFVAKKTGIWRMYGEPKNFTIDKVSKIGMETDCSLQKFNDLWVFLNKDGWHKFDGRSDAKRIDEPIQDIIPKIPTFDIDDSGGGLDVTLDTKAEWTNYNDDGSTGSTASENITINDEGDSDGSITITPMTAAVLYEQTTSSQLWDFTSTCRRFAFRIAVSATDVPFVLDSVDLHLEAAAGQSGTLNFYFVKGTAQSPIGETIDSVTDVAIGDIPTSEDWYNVDFGANQSVTESGYYWIICWWSTSVTQIKFGALNAPGSNYYVMLKYPTHWANFSNKQGTYRLYETEYEGTGTYRTFDTHDTYVLDFGEAPSKWGYFVATVNEPQKIRFFLSTSTDKSTWSGMREIYRDEIIPEVVPLRRYADIKIIMTRVDKATTPKVYNIKVNGFTSTGEVTDRLIYSTIFQDKYICATNENLDAEYRTFVLDKGWRWTIYPDQLIRGYIDYDNEKYLLSIDTNAKLYKMYRGTTIDEFNDDYSVETITSTTNYYQILRSKKYDCGFPDIVKLFRMLRFSVGTVFSGGYLQGTLKYRIDDGTWTTQYFQDETAVGDTSVIKLAFPAGTRGQYIQLEWRTLVSGDNYGHPFNIKDAMLDFYTQKLEPTDITTTGVPSGTGYMEEE